MFWAPSWVHPPASCSEPHVHATWLLEVYHVNSQWCFHSPCCPPSAELVPSVSSALPAARHPPGPAESCPSFCLSCLSYFISFPLLPSFGFIANFSPLSLLLIYQFNMQISFNNVKNWSVFCAPAKNNKPFYSDHFLPIRLLLFSGSFFFLTP